MNPSVVAIVLNYNGAADTIACVRSLERCTYTPLDILVVDNGSSNECGARLQSELPGTNFLFTGCNLGFAAGNNRGFEHVASQDPDYVLFLNNDTLVEPDFLDPLVEALEGDPRAAAAGGTICYYPRTDVIWYGGGTFRPLHASSFVTYKDLPVDRLPQHASWDVSFLTGCMMLIRAEVFQKVGLFDERFFMYFEDAELSVRLLSRGYKLLFVRASRIYHKIQDRPLSPFVSYYWMRNRFLFMQTSISGWKRPVAYAYLYAVTLLKFMLWSIVKPHLFRAAGMGLRDFFENHLYEGRGTTFLGPRS